MKPGDTYRLLAAMAGLAAVVLLVCHSRDTSWVISLAFACALALPSNMRARRVFYGLVFSVGAAQFVGSCLQLFFASALGVFCLIEIWPKSSGGPGPWERG